MEIGPAITALCALVLALLKAWQDSKPKRDEERKVDDDASLREECQNIDADAISARIDQLLSKGDCVAGVSSPSDKAGRTSP